MKLQAKVLSGYVVSLLLVILVGLWGVLNLRRLGQASEEILQENYRSIRAADSMLDALERQDSATLALLLNSSEDERTLFRQYEMLFLQWLGRAKDNITLSAESETLAELETAYQSYLVSVDQLIALPDGELDAYEQLVGPTFSAVRESAVRLREINQAAMIEASEAASETSQQAIISVAIAGLSAAAIGFIISWIFSRSLVRPIEAIRSAAEQIADGDYDVQLAMTSKDELGQLANEVNVMSQRLQTFKALNFDKLVTEKQRSEAIIYSLSDGIIVVDNQLHIVAINPAAAAIFGTKISLAEGRHCLEITDNRQLYSHIQAVVEDKVSAATAEADTRADTAADADNLCAELVLERGSVVEHYQYLATPVTTEDNRRLGVVLLLQNVTNLKKIDQLKSDFVMTASHELRTPLTGMAMSIDLLLETAQEKLSENEQVLLKTAQEDVQRLRDLVNDLLDLSKIESGKLEMDKSSVSAGQMVDKAINMLNIQATENKIKLVSRSAHKLPPVEADINKVTWVLTNLIANALRYAQEKIEVVTKTHGRWISISVVDDGPGIDPAYQNKIFDKFVQVKTEKDVGGTGLGLAICKEIIKAHGGRIWVDSTPGHGSTFSFTLPVGAQTSTLIHKDVNHA